jgi:hypothetical protein
LTRQYEYKAGNVDGFRRSISARRTKVAKDLAKMPQNQAYAAELLYFERVLADIKNYKEKVNGS